jgi:hypothetical protein
MDRSAYSKYGQGSNPLLKEPDDRGGMKPNLPNWLFVGGIGALSLSNTCKEFFPATLGRIFALHWGCVIVSAILFSLGLFLSLYGLISKTDHRKRYVLPCICNLTLPVLLMSFYFVSYVLATRFYDFGMQPPNWLPSLVEGTQMANSEAKRIQSAQVAYAIYGVALTYRRDSGEIALYEPSKKDIASREEHKQGEVEKQKNLSILKGAFDQWPYLFGFYMGAFFLTFVIGSLWVAFMGVRSK